MTPVRLDIVSQPIGAGNLSDDIWTTLTERLQALDQIISHKGAFRFPVGQSAYVPHELARLALSLRWSDRRFKVWLTERRGVLSDIVGPERLAMLIEEGVTGVEPMEVLAARFGSADRSYIRERLFESLERRIAMSGSTQGTVEFLKQSTLSP